MGDCGPQPWENDEAADWFHRFWKGGFSVLIGEIRNFDPRRERYDEVRAAAHLLQSLGIAYLWPSEHGAELKPLLNEAISILTKMINPPSDEWGFLDMWSNDPDVIKSVENQIDGLKGRLSQLVTLR